MLRNMHAAVQSYILYIAQICIVRACEQTSAADVLAAVATHPLLPNLLIKDTGHQDYMHNMLDMFIWEMYSSKLYK